MIEQSPVANGNFHTSRIIQAFILQIALINRKMKRYLAEIRVYSLVGKAESGNKK